MLALLHLLGVVVWVGGMFFAYMALRPAAAKLLEPPERLSLWAGTFERFFPWVWISIVLIFSSGLSMIQFIGGFAALSRLTHVMLVLGLIMAGIFLRVFFSPYVLLKKQVAEKNWKQAADSLGQIRQLISVNLAIGLVNIAIGALAR